jgi:hypothetical protein
MESSGSCSSPTRLPFPAENFHHKSTRSPVVAGSDSNQLVAVSGRRVRPGHASRETNDARRRHPPRGGRPEVRPDRPQRDAGAMTRPRACEAVSAPNGTVPAGDGLPPSGPKSPRAPGDVVGRLTTGRAWRSSERGWRRSRKAVHDPSTFRGGSPGWVTSTVPGGRWEVSASPTEEGPPQVSPRGAGRRSSLGGRGFTRSTQTSGLPVGGAEATPFRQRLLAFGGVWLPQGR